MIAHDERRVIPTPFHSRVAAACELNLWEDWKGYTTVSAFTDVALEYFAVRNSCGIFDLTPMIKYRITGRDAGAYLSRLVTRNILIHRAQVLTRSRSRPCSRRRS